MLFAFILFWKIKNPKCLLKILYLPTSSLFHCRIFDDAVPDFPVHTWYASIWYSLVMANRNLVWNVVKKSFTFGIIGVTISDRYASVVPIRGASMSPTFNPIATSLTGPMTGNFLNLAYLLWRDGTVWCSGNFGFRWLRAGWEILPWEI